MSSANRQSEHNGDGCSNSRWPLEGSTHQKELKPEACTSTMNRFQQRKSEQTGREQDLIQANQGQGARLGGGV